MLLDPEPPKPVDRCIGRFSENVYNAEALMILRSDKGLVFRFIKGGDMSTSFEKLWGHFSESNDERWETQ